MRMEAIIPVDQTSMAFPMTGVFDDFGGDAVERAGERYELLARRMDEFCSVKDEQRGVKTGKWMRTCMLKLTMTMSLSGSLERSRMFSCLRSGRGERGEGGGEEEERASGGSRRH